MYISKSSNYFSQNRYGDDKSNQADVDKDLKDIFTAIQGRLRFGSGTSGNKGENIGGIWLKVLTSGTANLEVWYSHSLSSQPMGYIVVWQDKAGNLYSNPEGGGVNTAWTSGTAYFKSDTVFGNYMVFLLERGGQ